MDNPSYKGYNFWGNTFSDLGRLVAHNGETNLASMILFTIAYSSIAVTFLPFYYKFPQIFEKNSSGYKSSFIGSIFGGCASLFFIGVIFTPADILRPPHMVFAFGAYALTFFSMASYSLALHISGNYPKNITYIYIILTITFFVILMVDIIGLGISRTIMVIGQKLGRMVVFLGSIFLIYEPLIN